jgi:hypothetical protein
VGNYTHPCRRTRRPFRLPVKRRQAPTSIGAAQAAYLSWVDAYLPIANPRRTPTLRFLQREEVS